jgi:uncharacterized membrane protein YccC
MGQWLSLPMIAAGIALFAWSRSRPRGLVENSRDVHRAAARAMLDLRAATRAVRNDQRLGDAARTAGNRLASAIFIETA